MQPKYRSRNHNGAPHRMYVVAVGIRLTPYPPHRSVRADFPHTALTSGGDAQTARRIRTADMGRRKPFADEPFHSFPLDATMLASPAQSAMPEVAHGVTKMGQSMPVARHSEVSDMPAHNGLQPLSDFRNRVMHAPPQADLHLLQLGLHALANRLPKHHEPSLLCLPADVREAEEVEGLGLTQTSNCWYYDQWGNRLDAEGSATAYSSTAGGASPCSGQPVVQYNTNNQMTGSGAPSYDQAGDATSDAKGRQYLYDAEGRICAVQGAAVDGISAMVGYIYDADGNRVAKGPITSWSCDPTTNGFESSAYETDYVLNQSGQTVTETTKSDTGVMQWNFTNVYANGVLFATYDAQGLHFLLNDWLGTRRASTDYEGVLESLCASLPYGDGLNCTNSPQSPNEQHFTGKQHDQESGNDYFGARYYSENDARFLTPDWSAKVEPVPYAKLGDPQSLNLYSYMLDSPLDGVDQNGHARGCPGGCSSNMILYTNPYEQGDVPAGAAQQQNGDPTLPTEVQPPPPSMADRVMTALMPKTPLDLALLVGTDGLGEAGAALLRVTEVASSLGKTADFVTLAITETKEGTSVVSSSEKALRPAVRALLKPGEVAANGAGHAEVTGVNAARQMGLTPTGVAASRGICPSCADFLRTAGVAALSALKATLPF